MRLSLFRWAQRATKVHKGKLAELGAHTFPSRAPLGPAKETPSTMLGYIWDVMQQHPQSVVLAQVGSFYELHFNQAVEWGPPLNLKVARKRQQCPVSNAPFVNMAGFPVPQLERFVRQLIENHNKTVVLLEQDQKAIADGSIESAKRPMTRIVTPGTLIAESFMNSQTNNWLVSLQPAPHTRPTSEIGLVWVDIAGGGQVRFQSTTWNDIDSDIARISPAEILLEDGRIADQIGENHAFVNVRRFPPRESIDYERWFCDPPEAVRYIVDHHMSERTQKAFAAVLDHISETHPGSHIQLGLPRQYNPDEVMQLDARARDALELSEVGSGSAKGSLLSTLRRTVTQPGARLLHQWLSEPLRHHAGIMSRQEKVQRFLDDSAKRDNVRALLSGQPDGPRLLQKLGARKLEPLDLVAIAQSIENAAELRQHLSEFEEWAATLDCLTSAASKTAGKILRAIDFDQILRGPDDSEEPNDLLVEKGDELKYIPILRPATSKRLRDLWSSQASFSDRRAAIAKRLSEEVGVNLTLRWSAQYGYHAHIKSPSPAVDHKFEVLSRSKKTANIIDREWRQLGHERDEFGELLRREEARILEKLRSELIQHSRELRNAYEVLASIDAHLSLAVLAIEKNLVKPEIVEAPILDIKGGRHISVEMGRALGGHSFTVNDCELTLDRPVCMVTGPNMGGKSTFIRQGAVIALLAHIGCWVPANSAVIGLVDRIFCRIGAGDDLYRGRSTFMMEMLETSTILGSASRHSLAILDEVGRGTAPLDGLALAYATIQHLSERNHCRTLFATHFGPEIASALGGKHISYLKATVDVAGDDVHFNYKLKPGVATDSHGLMVAKMAGFPKRALDNAWKYVQGVTIQ